MKITAKQNIIVTNSEHTSTYVSLIVENDFSDIIQKRREYQNDAGDRVLGDGLTSLFDSCTLPLVLLPQPRLRVFPLSRHPVLDSHPPCGAHVPSHQVSEQHWTNTLQRFPSGEILRVLSKCGTYQQIIIQFIN